LLTKEAQEMARALLLKMANAPAGYDVSELITDELLLAYDIGFSDGMYEATDGNP
jgi:hypothetical protein